MKTRKRLESLYDKIERLEQEVFNLQESCTHPNLKKTYGGTSGNYDPSVDKDWVDYDCPDCDKTWRIYSNG